MNGNSSSRAQGPRDFSGAGFIERSREAKDLLLALQGTNRALFVQLEGARSSGAADPDQDIVGVDQLSRTGV
jgi:hypothetical protein